jgi:membrane protein DedA with SNARE-associated domain
MADPLGPDGHMAFQFLFDLMGQLDYFAIFVLMAAESSILPVPSELVMIPAGYLAFQGNLNPWLALLSATAGSLAGSLGSYYLAWWLGRRVILQFGKYLLITPRHLEQSEQFVERHGEVAIFTGRFIPGIRHLISMPAGVARMRLSPFMIYTVLGAGMWNAILLLAGYYIGENRAWLQQHLVWFIAGAVIFAAAVLGVYLYRHRRRR